MLSLKPKRSEFQVDGQNEPGLWKQRAASKDLHSPTLHAHHPNKHKTQVQIASKNLRQDGLSKNLPIPPMLNIWSLPDVPELVILAVFMSIKVKKSGEYFGLIKS